MVDHLEEDIIDVPYAIFGHSYGAIVAFELVREISRRNLVLPMHFFASSSPSPMEVSVREKD